ncbi:MAG: dipeptidase [Planctomycetes bacterium]|nr:dipeptidase [Planctomycetota bacterium]
MNNKMLFLILALCVCISISVSISSACTNLIITKGASKTGSVTICYTCDAGFASKLHWLPAGKHAPGSLVKYPSFNPGVPVKQIPETYATLHSNGIGHMNEYQLAIGETTFGGRRGIGNKTGLSYGELMTLALQRCKTARQAIKCIADLAAEYGYRASGESLSIGDTKEAWIMELVGNGPDNKGIVWVAVRVPDGHVSCHANQSRITEFPRNDPKNCMYSEDVISFAVEQGFYDPDSGKPFNYSDAYHPASDGTKKSCAQRVWSMLRRSAPSLNLSPDYARGVENAPRYPLSVKPDQKLSMLDVYDLLRDHYEGTDFDMTKGPEAGKFGCPNHRRERAISTVNTAFSIITQSRDSLPNHIGGICWYSPDDTYFSCYTPIYCSTTEIPKPYTLGNTREFSWDSAWWAINFVANYANMRYSEMKVDIQKTQSEIENNFYAQQPEIEKQALALYKKDPRAARQFLTKYTVDSGEMVIKRWKDLAFTLMAKYNDR